MIMEDVKVVARSLMEFLDKSPVNFLAVRTAKEKLEANGFVELDPREKWNLNRGGKYYMTKNSHLWCRKVMQLPDSV